ncbi:MAG: hypothetical protein V7744_04890 [Pseudomonadales bacterium]
MYSKPLEQIENRRGGFYRAAIVGGTVFLASLCSQVFADSSDGWGFSLAPMYLWGKNIDGTSTIAGMDAPLDLDFQDDILKNLDAALAFHFEAKHGDIALFVEYNYGKLDPSSVTNVGSETIEVNIDFKDVMGELGVAYTFADSGSTQWEVLGGVRQFDQKIDVDIGTSIDGPGILPDKIAGGDDWWQGFGGVRVKTKLSARWSLVGRADIGYKNTNNKAAHAIGFFDYRFRDWGSFFAGYRYLDTHYDNGKSGYDSYAFDAKQQGPILGLNFYF